MAEKKHVIEYIDIIKAFEKVKEKLKNKSNKGHQHGNADITDIDASKIKSGTIDIDRLPKGAIERMVYVKDDAARFALTTNTTQNGDTVKVTSTKKMFYVIDDTKLSSEAGYEPYTAESASAVPWSGVTGKPATFTPEAHTHAISDVTDLQETLTGLRQDVNAKPSKDTNTTYSLTQDSTDGHKLTFKGSDGSTKTVTIPDNDHNDNTTYSLKKTGSKIQLVGSDGSTTEVTDDNTTYDLDAMINALPVGTDDPVDNDYYVSQNADGGTSNTGYFRRPVSKLWNYIKTKLAAVATSGSYTDLSNKPTIGNGKVTVNQNGTTKGTFTMNQTGDTIINLTDNDTDTNTWRDVVDGLDSTRTDASLSANQGRVLNGKFASYLPLSGGDMTGDITFNGHGASTIGSGSQDGAGLDAKNNLNIASWYGVSFTSKCAGFAYSDKPGVSIDCRNGTLAVAGAIYANGGVVGDLTGNAKTATTANSANSAKYINYSINKYVTGDSMKTPYWRFATIEVSSDWYDQSVILLVNTGCVGGGFGIIKLSVRSNQISNTENAYCEFSWLVRRGFDPNQFIVKGYSASKTTNYFDIYFKATGVYQGITVTVLSSGSRGNISFDWKLTNDEPRAAMDLRTYNYELVSSDEGVVDYASTANHLYNIDGSNTKHPMTFNWSGKDGQPTWLWGGEDGSNMYVYNPANFNVNYAKGAGIANSVAWGNVSGRPTALSSFTNDKGYITGITKAMVTGALGYTPPTSDTNTTYSASTGLNLSGTSFSVKYGSTEGTACQGNDSRLSNSRPASDVYAWAKASSKPSYSWSEIGGRPSSLPANGGTSDYSNKVYATSHPGTWYLDTSWDGTYFQSCFKNGNNTLPMRVANANYADSAGSAGSVSWGNVSGRPTALSSFTNDSGFITGSDSRLTNARPASDVYSWAKASSKPSYTWTEISNKPDIPSISKYTPTRTNWTINSEYNCVVYRIGDFCLAVVAVTGTIYPRQWLPAAQLSKDFTPKIQSSIVVCSVSGSDHMECMVTKDGYIKMWWSGSSPATSANICVPYYMG